MRVAVYSCITNGYDTIAALKAGEFYSSQGPRLIDVDVTPAEIRVECSPVQAITLLTGTSRSLSVVGSQITSGTFDLANVQKHAWVNPGLPKWFRIAVIDAGGRRAWTNPIWIDELG